MADDVDVRQAEIERVRAAVKDIAKLMNGSFELDESKLQALSLGPDVGPDIESSGTNRKPAK